MSLTKKMIAIPVGSIVRICVHIAVKYSPIDYIILQPNKNMNTIDHCIYSLYVHVDYRAKRAFLVCYMILLYIPFLLFMPGENVPIKIIKVSIPMCDIYSIKSTGLYVYIIMILLNLFHFLQDLK